MPNYEIFTGIQCPRIALPEAFVVENYYIDYPFTWQPFAGSLSQLAKIIAISKGSTRDNVIKKKTGSRYR